ncbi:ABC transporter substrate-binding protein [Pseudarthrobacter enclensis]|uniref:Multiple sugar transport system substrate-binding protein n=1 Tax=Pseudarthrobacter enclensis TaxID=993070 RepID=A0ABT9RQM7_9MICC|nr:ABC transporter substrate-binding protein [Pseudarthrobacter enclensis]MDP9887537.1 multiple sugar transport system substrate-binding protein [Pseudarthrobacter enclensis]
MSAPFLASCAGFDTSGASAGQGTVGFLSTQFTPVEEKQRYEAVLRKFAKVPTAYNSVDPGVFASTVTSQAGAGNVKTSLLGGLHGELAPLAGSLEDVDGLLRDLSGRGFTKEMLDLTKVGGSTSRYVPWMQATYVVAVNKKALEWLPAGVDVNDLTYEGYLAWAKSAKQGAGRPVFGMPAGPKGLHHRFYQGFLLPSFTGGQITTFRSQDAVGAWDYMQELWSVMAPASTNYDYMQEPLARGEVLVAWDHVARLVNAPADKPDDWLMVPAPRGPKGRGYMLIIAGMALPKNGKDRDLAEKAIRALTEPAAQIETLRSNAFFPVVQTELPSDLTGAIALEAAAVRRQQRSAGALLALPPVGLGAKEGEVSQIFKNCFQQICLETRPVQQVLDTQATQLNTILKGLNIPCWAPDPISTTCEVA